MLLEVKVSISNGKNLYIRQNPSTSARIMGKYTNGTKGIIVDQKKTLPSGQVWYRVKETGYWIAQNNPNDKVVKSYLVVTKNLEKEDKPPKPIKPETPKPAPPVKIPEEPKVPEKPKQPNSPDDPALDNSMKPNPDGDSVWHQEVKR